MSLHDLPGQKGQRLRLRAQSLPTAHFIRQIRLLLNSHKPEFEYLGATVAVADLVKFTAVKLVLGWTPD